MFDWRTILVTVLNVKMVNTVIVLSVIAFDDIKFGSLYKLSLEKVYRSKHCSLIRVDNSFMFSCKLKSCASNGRMLSSIYAMSGCVICPALTSAVVIFSVISLLTGSEIRSAYSSCMHGASSEHFDGHEFLQHGHTF